MDRDRGRPVTHADKGTSVRDQREPETRAIFRRWRPRLGLIAPLSAVVALLRTALIGPPALASTNPRVDGKAAA